MASSHAAIPTAPEPLALSRALGKPLLNKVDALILDIVKEEIPLIHDIAEHIVASGGKRLRPLLTLLCAKVCGYDGQRHINLAAAVEFIHTATLLHDDVVDESALRRGHATANNVWGNKPSILVGDFIFSQAFRLMVADGSLEVLDILSNAAAVITKGEVLQLATEGNIDTSQESYLEVVIAKTAALFSSACEIGPILGGKSELRGAFREYGNALGIAFQMMDDLLDYQAQEQMLGKTVGDDFRERKVTLPVILALKVADKEEKVFWQAALTADESTAEGFATALRIFKRHDIQAQVRTIAESYCKHAEAQIKLMPQNEVTNTLQEIVNFCRNRAY